MRRSETSGGLRLGRLLFAPLLYETAKTALLLLMMLLGIWILLAVFRVSPQAETAGTRLGHAIEFVRRDSNGLPIQERFVAAALASLRIVFVAGLLLGLGATAIGVAFAVRPWTSTVRLPLALASAVPAFMFPILGFPQQSAWFWPALCLALGDMNLAALSGRCYDAIQRELREPYVRTALAQGRSVWSDVWPRAALVVLEGLRARVPHLLGGTVAVEYVYNIHGVGAMALHAVLGARPEYGVLVWIAGLGIVLSRLLCLAHRIARAVLTPERGRRSAWAESGAAVSLLALWKGGVRPAHGPDIAARARQWLSSAAAAAGPPPGSWTRLARRAQSLWRLSRVNHVKLTLAAGIGAIGCALLALSLYGGPYTMLQTDSAFLPASPSHPLGTNVMGEDVLSMVALGGRDLVAPLAVAVLTAVALGGFFGTASGLCLGSIPDMMLDLCAEFLEAIPKLILVLALVTAMQTDAYSVKLYMLMGLAFAPLVFRTVRDEVGALRTSLFLEAAVTIGVPRSRILFHHVLRKHALPVLVVEGAAVVGYVLLFDAILGFCGVRQYGEVFTWGSLLGTGLDELPRQIGAGIAANPWIVWGPFAATMIAIGCSIVAGELLKSLGQSVRFS